MSGPIVYQFSMYDDVNLTAFITTGADSNVIYSPQPDPARIAMTIRRPLGPGTVPLEAGNIEIVPRVPGESGLQDYVPTNAELLGVYSGMIRAMIPASYFRVPGVYQVGFETTGALSAVDPMYAAQDNPSYMAPIILNITSEAPATKGTVVQSTSTSVVRVSGLPDSDANNHWSRCYLRMATGDLVPQYSKIATSVMLFHGLQGAGYVDTLDVDGDYIIIANSQFTDYVHQAGDTIRVLAGTGLVAQTVGIAEKVDDNKIRLDSSIGASTSDLFTESLTELTVTNAFTSAPASGELVVVVAE